MNMLQMIHSVNHYIFGCILISRFSSVEILLHFNVAFSTQCSASIYQAFDGQSELLWILILQFFSDSKLSLTE